MDGHMWHSMIILLTATRAALLKPTTLELKIFIWKIVPLNCSMDTELTPDRTTLSSLETGSTLASVT